MKYVHFWRAAPEPDARTLLLLHGTGADEHDLLPVAEALDPAANVLSPRGNVLENGAPRFFARFGPGRLDVEDLKRRTHDLADFVEEAAKAYRFDPTKVDAFGYSNGANVAASLLFLRPATLRSAVLARAMMPYEPSKLPAVAGRRVLVLAGAADPYSAGGPTERLAATLKAGGAAVTVNVARAGHELTPQDVAVARAWMEAGT